MFNLLAGPSPAALRSKASTQDTSVPEKEISFIQGHFVKMEREAMASELHFGELTYKKGIYRMRKKKRE